MRWAERSTEELEDIFDSLQNELKNRNREKAIRNLVEAIRDFKKYNYYDIFIDDGYECTEIPLDSWDLRIVDRNRDKGYTDYYRVSEGS